jgi:hypothetical protein
MKLRTYARRQLNPFEGVLQIAETDLARAFSVNGQIWQIQVLGARPTHTWRSSNANPPIGQFFNWAMWSQTKGLQQVNANPILNLGTMSEAGEELINQLPKVQLLFTLQDPYECWACDHQIQPVALLASNTTKPA